MDNNALLVGNDINNVVDGNSWAELLSGLTQYLSIKVEFPTEKPFPLAYEEIFFKTIKNTSFKEVDIKKYVAQHIENIQPGIIHNLILRLGIKDILTTNYDLSLEKSKHSDIKNIVNKGIVLEQKYSLFRKHVVENTNFWHIHGSSSVHRSITLGYEHYSGYLQYMRNYIVSGTKDTYKKKTFKPLLKRIKAETVENESWLDLFFTKNIHIFGLSLDFVESDLWWLLTFREKMKCEKRYPIYNEIYYYIPVEFVVGSKAKIDMLDSLGVKVMPIHGHASSKQFYYENVIARIGSFVK
ncbi:SIR2 family protein [Pseudoalteromonas denitrificans]|uniref:SIR2-like domain-containing protein n=1 Tax=Pseudoalteromonas denitrificans DSM 6059 TaxID=1123010 RepID=A0A1I1TBZ3_9GAMM|nr:SIR2 family protein [Pseudoalteromonas denitrificans]SFD52980.1 SIR2-like domain-containing protein [Pseudoalteromonas denitrificans DSM 6059]